MDISSAITPSIVAEKYSVDENNSLRFLVLSINPSNIREVINWETAEVLSATCLAIFFSVLDLLFMDFNI
jgi:hypothetical protein